MDKDYEENEGVSSQATRDEILHTLTGTEVFVYTSLGVLPKMALRGTLHYDGNSMYRVFTKRGRVFFHKDSVKKICDTEIQISFS